MSLHLVPELVLVQLHHLVHLHHHASVVRQAFELTRQLLGEDPQGDFVREEDLAVLFVILVHLDGAGQRFQ